MQNPTQAKITIKQAKKEAQKLTDELIEEKLEGQLDVMVDTLKLSNRTHWDMYRTARNIIDLGGTFAKVRGVITDKNGGLPLANVKFTVSEAGTSTVVKQVVTDGEGKFTSGQLGPGNYDLKWELKGYMMESEPNVNIPAGKELQRKFSMKAGGGSATVEGDVAAGAIVNIQVMGLVVVPETTIRVTVTGSNLRWYAATGNMEPPGTQYLDIVNGQIIQKTVIQFAALVGFDNELEDFLNVQNNGTVTGHYKLEFKNLGS
jgi:5-hydroxyisourate hydrolase-like protein (transthyretin family)